MSKKILLVEDDAAILDIYKTVLEKAHFEVDTAVSGQEAIGKVTSSGTGENKPLDLIILDLILPDMNGMDILAQVKKNPTTKNTKVFIMTNQELSKEDAGGPKPDQYIIKANITPSQLVALIKKEI